MTEPIRLAPEQSGVYRSPPDLHTLREGVAASGARWFAIDLAPVHTKHVLLKTFARALGFPATFGYNWDALADALQDMSGQSAQGYVLHVQHAASVAPVLREHWRTLLEVLTGSTMYWKTRGKPFIVFIDGAQEAPQWV